MSGKNIISMASITCPANSVDCNTVSNSYLPTMAAPHEYTGLAAINVGKAQDWRVYYYDEGGNVSEMAGNSSGFDMGTPIGGLALNGSDIAAVNINSTTNDINLFYVDQLTEALFTMEFKGAWTTRKFSFLLPISQSPIPFPPFSINLINTIQQQPSLPNVSHPGTPHQVSEPPTPQAKTSYTSTTPVSAKASTSSGRIMSVFRTGPGWRSRDGIICGPWRIISVRILLLLGKLPPFLSHFLFLFVMFG
jgi:hypothetical protein